LSKVQPEAMQEIQDNTSVDPCSNIPNELVRPYIVVPTYLMELLWNFSHPVLGSQIVEPFVCVSPAKPLFEIDRREYGDRDNMVPQL
jgi:hypothetical protein